MHMRYKKGNRWRARIGHHSRNRKDLGYFSTKEEAARAYDREAIKRYGEFAYTNFPREEYKQWEA